MAHMCGLCQVLQPGPRGARKRAGGGKQGRGNKCDISLRTFGPYFEILFGVGDSRTPVRHRRHVTRPQRRHGKREGMREYNTYVKPKLFLFPFVHDPLRVPSSDVHAAWLRGARRRRDREGPPQAKARRRRRGAGAEPLLRGGWNGEHSKT